MGFSVNGLLCEAASLVSIFIICFMLTEAGFFKWSAQTMVLTAEGKGRRLFIHMLMLGVLISIIFDYYGIIAIFTPIVYEIAKELNIKRVKLLQFLFFIVFIVRIIIEFYLDHLITSYLIEIIMIYIILFAYFYKIFYMNYNTEMINNPDDSVKDWSLFNIGLMLIIIIMVINFIGRNLNINVILIQVAGAVILVIYRLCKY